ncbi:MAG: hypothetical protein A2845_03240 [Candidatus Lloydbacteria bacterium RIFCSPHIGHO2_01_FULL_49_22]|uniref:DUF5671 domain-containing protein n=1 Tax=Candidatus Lloydbacteria bacterium RIFCSPHIGHO2_01_FULL_49_22 TaxID=1798658 RepID=A0A1G2CX37_9BACT|nr:MAG: hypothetical protein A2845_03240 [Candidatus Lloydbacteria bacterium RIFCSPHIGHO2_01_FULL_49_22]OGZ08945.1 MAG: hypothetical protein A3C14_03075 [Candidatus Lloydbacteria bacterium RIFCSPHIGHO2_02_FULL_50_18]
MINEAIANYVRDERARGVADQAIRAELSVKGWKSEDINAALPKGDESTTIATKSKIFGSALLGTVETAAFRLLLLGFVFFLVSSVLLALFYGEAKNDLSNQLVFALFSLTHIVNASAAYFLFLTVWKLSRSVWFRIWIGIMAFIVALFAIFSFAHFVSIATGYDFFMISKALFGDEYFPVIIYFILLPLQAVVFLLLTITLWTLKNLHKRRTGRVLLLRAHLATTGLFFLMALLALGDFIFVLSNSF